MGILFKRGKDPVFSNSEAGLKPLKPVFQKLCKLLKSLHRDALDSQWALEWFLLEYEDYISSDAKVSELNALDASLQAFRAVSLLQQHLFILKKMSQMKLHIKPASEEMRQAAAAEGL